MYNNTYSVLDSMQVLASPFRVMKIMSEYFGYTVPVCPIEGGLTIVFFTSNV